MIIEVKVPAAGESVTEATISAILAETGTYVEEDQPILELETDKASMPLNAEKGGVVTILAAEEDVVAVGDIVAKIDTEAEGAPAKKEEPETKEEKTETQVAAKEEVKEAKSPAAKSVGGGADAHSNASPAAATLMGEHGLTDGQVHGTGHGGRIMKEDVINAIKNPVTRVPSMGDVLPPMPDLGYAPSLPQAIEGERETKKKMSTLRKVIAKRLVSAQHEAAMLTTFNEVDMSSIMELRKLYKERFKETHGIGLGFMSFFVKACVEALKSSEAINAYIDGDNIVYRNYYDISIAVSTPKGLVVPVVRDCDKKSFSDVEKSIYDYAIRGREGKLSMDEMQGGGFTITNGGTFGSLLSTPILNPPQSAILGMHKIDKRPVVVNDEIVIRPMMYLALSYDHRIVDGKEAVTFLVKIKECLEDPAKIMLEL